MAGPVIRHETDYESLLPWNWAQDHPEAIRHYRVTERNKRAAAKENKRAERRKKKSQRP